MWFENTVKNMNNTKHSAAYTPHDASSREESTMQRVNVGLARRYRRERLFRYCGLGAIIASIGFLLLLFISITANGWTAFIQTEILLDIKFSAEHFDVDNLSAANYGALVKSSMRQLFPDVKNRSEKRKLYKLVSSGAVYRLQKMVMKDTGIIGTTQAVWLPADDEVDMFAKGRVDRDLAENNRRLNDKQIHWIDTLSATGRLKKKFNTTFFTAGDSREPELAGIRGATAGSLFTLAVTLFLSFPIGVATAVYLEEFAPKNKWTDLVEVNINNLAAVPSIVFGLLGLAFFLNILGMPRSAPLVGGLVLTLMTLPTIIIASRASLKSVPPSIKEAALGVGASKMQAITHHILPLALPGMMTGTIIGMAQALGETAPLLMIGMVAFIVDVPGSVTDPATVLPVQIYLWADSPERAFVERTSAAIMVLLAFLISMNAIAVFLRRKFERRW